MNIKELLLTPNKWSRPQTTLKPVKGIIVHWVANKNSTAEANRNYFERRKAGHDGYGSAHYIIDLDGTIIRCLPEREVAYHVGTDLPYKSGSTQVYTPDAWVHLNSNASKTVKPYPNDCTIGIECTHIDDNGKMTDATYSALVELCADLLKRYKLSQSDLWTHQEVVGWKDCHRWFVKNPSEWTKFKNLVGTKINNSTSVEKEATTVATTTGVVTADTLNIRSGAGTSFKIVGTIPKNGKVTITGESNGWYKVTYNGVSGYASATYITKSSTTPSTPTKPTTPTPTKYAPTITKERINSTDVMWMKLDPKRIKVQFVYEKGATVQQLVKKHGADYGINLPFFYNGAIIGDSTSEGKTISSAASTSKTKKWHSFAFKDGKPIIGMLNPADKYDFLVQSSPKLVSNGNLSWSYYGHNDDTAPDIMNSECQRTSVGIDKDGNLIVAVTDGREGKGNVGLSIKEIAEYMYKLGCVQAMNGDGGSSSVLATKDKILIGGSRVTNHAVLITLL